MIGFCDTAEWKRGVCTGPAFENEREPRAFHVDRASQDRKKHPSCFRNEKRPKFLGPGLFLLLCMHGIVLAFWLMKEPESERSVVEFLWRHCRQRECHLA